VSDYTTTNTTSLTLAKFNTEPVMTIHPDGRVTVTDKLKPDEAAAKVVEAFKTRWMADVQATKIRNQQERIKWLEEALESIREYWNRDNNNQALIDACWYAIDKAAEALEAKEAKL
jgi:ArsR family metal-binding transcriptional regulator